MHILPLRRGLGWRRECLYILHGVVLAVASLDIEVCLTVSLVLSLRSGVSGWCPCSPSSGIPPRFLAGCTTSTLSMYAHTPSFQCNSVICSWCAWLNHPIIFSLNFVKGASGKGFWKYICYLLFSSCVLDADCPFPYFLSKVRVLDVEMFSLGLILGMFAISIVSALSSKTLQCILGVAFNNGILLLPLAIWLLIPPSWL